jgi:lipid II:glycine glycyltransferase (peptidoglycan interpeptide bridge formation enzyme)
MLELPGNQEDAWSQLKSACRNRIRKAEKNQLVVEIVEDLSLADEYYDQFIEVYGKQGMITPFGPERPRSLMQCLVPAKRILPLRITHQGETVATGLFPFDENSIYFWGAASWLRHHKLCPNELLHWEVIKFAISRNIPRYNMCGGTSQFKDKFGGSDVPFNHYSLSSVPMMKQARNIYRTAHFMKLQAAGWFKTRGLKKKG